ncbi:MAG: phage integrase N-terminal SAM-like domain-containing protein [Candidatus Thiodiazotropha sp.]
MRHVASTQQGSRSTTHTTLPISPFRQRMLEGMALRKLSAKTQVNYIRWVKNLADFLRRSPDTTTVEELRLFHLRHSPAGAIGGHPRHPGTAWTQEAGDHGTLKPGRHRHAA